LRAAMRCCAFVNDEPVRSREDVGARGHAGARRGQGWGLLQDEIGGHSECWIRAGPPIRWSSPWTGPPLGPHANFVELVKDIKDDGHFHIPILFLVHSDVAHTEGPSWTSS
jgi:hypothetical protein